MQQHKLLWADEQNAESAYFSDWPEKNSQLLFAAVTAASMLSENDIGGRNMWLSTDQLVQTKQSTPLRNKKTWTVRTRQWLLCFSVLQSWQAWSWDTQFHRHYSSNIVSYGNPTTKPQKKWYNSFASHQSNDRSSALRHEGALWKENDLIRFPQQCLTRQYLVICRIDTAGRRWQKGEFFIQKLHSIYIFSIQTSTLCDRPTLRPASHGSGPSVNAETSAWPHSGPVCMQRPPSLTST